MFERRASRPLRHSRSRHHLRLAVGVMLTVLSTAACTVGPSSRPALAVFGGPSSSTATAPSRPIGPGGAGQNAKFDRAWQPCPITGRPATGAPEISCTDLTVPLDYAHPERGGIRLAVGRIRANGLPADAPTLVALMATGSREARLGQIGDLASLADSLPSEITAQFSIVSLDIRGVGGLGAANCFRDLDLASLYTLAADPSDSFFDRALADLTRGVTFGCQDHVDAGVANFDTTRVADDIDSLRSALGLSTLNYLGAGYGATAGAVYADRYPGRVGRMVLDGPTDHAVSAADRAAQSAIEYERALQVFLTDCVSRAACVLGDSVEAAIRTVDAAVQAFHYDPDHPNADVAVGSSLALWALTMALPDRTRWEALGFGIADAAAGDPETLSDLLDLHLRDSAVNMSVRLMLDCNDDGARLADRDLKQQLGTAAAAAPRFGPFLQELAALCRQWPAADSPLGGLRAEGAPALLMVGGVHDPVAPYTGVQAVAARMTSATLVSYQGDEHGGYPENSCVRAAVDDYLRTGTVPEVGRLCPA